MTDSITIGRRFEGPPNLGNGGYVSGRLAAHLDGPAAVRLRAPTPLEVALEVRTTEQGCQLAHNDTIIADARPGDFELELPEPPTFAEAEQAARSFRAFTNHPLSMCFVCGTAREAGDGLRLFPGSVALREIVACPWVPDANLADADGNVQPEFLWSALDCPGAFSFPQIEKGVALAGELAAKISQPVTAGERYIVTGWQIAHEGRKHFTGTAVFSESGECCAAARTIWIEVPEFERA